MTTVAITGVAGHVGRRLLDALDLHGEVERIVGIDLVPPRGSRSSKLAYRQLDVRDPELATALRGVDVVIHLAAHVPSPHDVELARSVNVDGARNVAAAARSVGARQLIQISSAFVYGAHPDNDLPLTESSPLRPTPGLHLGADQAQAEAEVAGVVGRGSGQAGTGEPDGTGGQGGAGGQDGTAGPDVAVLRLAMVLGPGIDNVLTRLLESPRLTTVRGHRPPLQFVHRDDAVRAIVHALEQRLVGTYNVCAEGWLSLDEVTAIARKRTVDVPEEVAYSAADRLWRLGIGEHPPGIVDHLMHPWVMSPDALIATGWRPNASNRDALAATVEEHAAYVSLAGARVRRRVLVQGVATATALIGLLAVRWRRRRRGTRAGTAELP